MHKPKELLTLTGRQLSAYETWMVSSNLETIRAGTPAAEQLATLRANGYPHIAVAVELALKEAGE